MLTIEAELKSLKLFGMAAGYAEVARQGLVSLQVSEGLLRHLLQAEAESPYPFHSLSIETCPLSRAS